MKKLASLALALSLAFSAAPAHAVVSSVIDLAPSGTYIDTLGTLSTVGTVYQRDFINSTLPMFSPMNTTFTGSLANNLKLTFSYTLAANGMGSSALSSMYSALSSEAHNSNPTSVSVTVAEGGNVFKPAVLDSGLVLLTANLEKGMKSGSTTLTNLTGKTVYFTSQMIAMILDYGVGMNVVATVSQVPLPAALPLFGLGIASLAAHRARKKKA